MRDDFNREIKETLAKRVGLFCSNPECRRPTIGPNSRHDKTINIGVASHITAASAGGPRYDKKLTAVERSSIVNAIWLCQSCAKLIDSDTKKYSKSLIQKWKAKAERDAEKRMRQKVKADNDDIYSLDQDAAFKKIIDQLAYINQRLDAENKIQPKQKQGPKKVNRLYVESYYWKRGETIQLYFMDGDKKLQDLVKKVASEWIDKTNVNLQFEFITALNKNRRSPIRISFKEPFSWAYMGIQSLEVPLQEPTMQLGIIKDLSNTEEKRFTILHEFGHMLGLIHEHQSPGIFSEWDWEKIYSTYSGPPMHWTKEEVDENFRTVNANEKYYKHKPFDPNSIMMYHFPSEFFIKPIRLPKISSTLSDGDKELICEIYGKK